MGSSIDQTPNDSLDAALRAEAARNADGFIPFDRFMAQALYHPAGGYYTTTRQRVGRSAETDFYTASSLGPIFGELIAAVAVHRIRQQSESPHDFTFVELGAEQGRSVLDGVAHPFRAAQPIGIGAAWEFSGPCVVFSNELFDAQPCARFRRTTSGWVELGAGFTADGTLENRERPVTADSAIARQLPDDCPPGYHLDWPQAAADLAQRIAANPWRGLFVALDYGHSWHELINECPQGTVRAYRQHVQTNDLLAQPGTQDLTCHICWDWIAAALKKSGFHVDPVVSQEAFFIQNAGPKLAELMQQEAARMSQRKSALLQLLHPSALGQKFQGLTAWRDVS